MTHPALRINALIWEFYVFVVAFVWSILRSVLAWIRPKRYKCLHDDVVLITGGGRGIGRDLAVEIAKHKPRQIVLWGRTEDPLRATCNAVELNGVKCTYMVCDVGDREQVYAKANELNLTAGPVSVLVNNAGIVYGQDVLQSEDEDMISTINVNVLAHFWTVKAFLPNMLSRGRGHIVTISSLLGFMGMGGAADYSASKFAALGFSEALQMELLGAGKPNIHITTVHPYLINTDMFAGLTSRFDWMFPPLAKEYVAWKTVDAVLTNQAQVIMPRFFYLFNFAKAILPVSSLQLMYKYAGLDKAMHTYHGRKNK